MILEDDWKKYHKYYLLAISSIIYILFYGVLNKIYTCFKG